MNGKNKKIWASILTALSGVLLVALCLCLLAETFFHAPVSAALSSLLNARTPIAVLVTLLLAIVLCGLGVGCIASLIPNKKKTARGFVMQKGENGAIGVSVRSIEGMVQTCIDQFSEVIRADVSVVEKRDGIVILMDIEETAGVNIPVIVGALQKQVKQYVTECTGVDVQEVRVMVENGEAPAAIAAPAQAVQELPAAPVMPMPEAAPAAEEDVPALEVAPEAEEAPAAEERFTEPAPAAPVVMPAMPEIPEKQDDRPLHQRLFGTEEQPAFVPAPPELAAMPAEEETAEAAEEAEGETAEETAEPLAETTDEDAVAAVAQAIAFDGVDLYEAVEEKTEPAETQE